MDCVKSILLFCEKYCDNLNLSFLLYYFTETKHIYVAKDVVLAKKKLHKKPHLLHNTSQIS